MHFRRPQLIPLLFIIASTLLLGGLGTWQVKRMHWKEDLLAQIADAQAMAPLKTLNDNAAFRRITLHGRFLHDKTLHMVGRPQGSSLGFFLLTPMVLEDGNTVLVNRGWAPKDAALELPARATVEGIVRPLRSKRFFTPENQPAKNVWFYEDIGAMADATGVALAPYVVEVVGKAAAGHYPQPGDGQIRMRNDHLGYAITWYGLALVGLIMFAFYHRQPRSTTP